MDCFLSMFIYLNLECSSSSKKKKKTVYFSFLPRDKNPLPQNNKKNKEARSFHRLVLRQNITKHKNRVDDFIHLFKVHFHFFFSFHKHKSATSKERIKTADAPSTE